MSSKRYLPITILSVFCIIFIANVAYALNTDNSNLTDGDYTLNTEQMNDVEYRFLFGLSPSGHEVIAEFGTLPELETEEQKQEWTLKLEDLTDKLKDDMVSTYMYPHGKVLTCGYNSNGYLVILFENEAIEQQLMDEIYAAVGEKAKDLGIQDVPVDFGHGVYWQQYEVDLEIMTEAEIKATEEYMKSGRGVYQPIVIARYGKLPLLVTDEQRSNWSESMSDILYESRSKIEPYMDEKQVVEYGIGYLSIEVGIDKDVSVDKQLLAAEIYEIFDEEAKMKSINNVPVVFIESTPYQPDVEIVEEIDEINNSNHNETKPDETSNISVPGFGLLGGLICLSGGWLFRRK